MLGVLKIVLALGICAALGVALWKLYTSDQSKSAKAFLTIFIIIIVPLTCFICLAWLVREPRREFTIKLMLRISSGYGSVLSSAVNQSPQTKTHQSFKDFHSTLCS